MIHKTLFEVMKINNLQGDIADISADTKTLAQA